MVKRANSLSREKGNSLTHSFPARGFGLGNHHAPIDRDGPDSANPKGAKKLNKKIAIFRLIFAT